MNPNQSSIFGKAYFLVCFTIPLFYVLHRNNEYYGLLNIENELIFLVEHIAFFAILYFILSKIIRNPQKGIILVITTMLFYFFFGLFQDTIKKIPIGARWTSYSYLLPTLLLVFVVICFLILKTKRNFAKSCYFFNLLFSVLVIYEVIVSCWNFASNENRNNNYSQENILPKLSIASNKLPDIYFIVFDEYTSSGCLQYEFAFDNSNLDSVLTRNKFFISWKSSANYNITPFSVASALNLDYLHERLAGKTLSAKLLLQGLHTMEKVHLPEFLGRNGYLIKNVSLFNLNNSESPRGAYFEHVKKDVLGMGTLAGRIKRDILTSLWSKNSFTKKEFLAENIEEEKQRHIDNNRNCFELLKAELNKSADQPRFVYCHIMLPHEPFYLDKNGNRIPDSIVQSQTNKQLYLGQVQYVNSLINQIIPLLKMESQRPVAAVIEGDHGYRFYDDLKDKKDIYKNLNAYYFSDGDYSGLYDGISPVNSFRVILNKYFHSSLRLLPDSSVYIDDKVSLLMK